jgi:hypothetical protein
VGRAPIDEDAIRLLEEHNPDVQFDWTRILKSPAPMQEQGRREDRRDRRERRERPRAAEPPKAAAERAEHAERTADAAERVETADYPESGTTADATEPAEAAADVDLADTAVADQLDTAAAEYADHAEDIREGAEALSGATAAPPDTDVAPRYARIGAEGLARLRGRYAEVMARIAERPLEETQREELRTKAERLNPDAWVTADEVAAALEQYETVFEELRAVVGRHQGRRRRRR